ncbi:MAG: hypothetical protein BRD38_05020 [Bacteroidetes bacterium QH_9_67_14]|nr:MAG: hypothetical protein BRD38_05020 [Bacteroidetes bacterium QH_9_67_14]
MPDDLQSTRLLALLPDEAADLLVHSGADYIERAGMEATRETILDVFLGQNIRSSTEKLTRERIARLGLGVTVMFHRGMDRWPDFLERLPYVAAQNLVEGGLSKPERWLNLWTLGLTNKGFQNVLRDDPQNLEDYCDQYVETCREVAEDMRECYGDAPWTRDNAWLLDAFLQNTVGSLTLTIRGSDKSTYGKLFEKLMLGPLLHVLGFEFARPAAAEGREGVYWLSSTSQRESDATLIYRQGQAVRFDIGFIGRGNPEIILDKVTRYRRHMALGEEEHLLQTIVIGDRSDVRELAREVEGRIVTMDTPHWPREVVRHLDDLYGFDHPLLEASDEEAKALMRRKLQSAPFSQYLRIAEGEENVQEDARVEIEE